MEIGKLLDLPVLNLWDAMVRHIRFADVSLKNITTSEKHIYIPGAKHANPDRRLQSYLRDGLHLSRTGYDLVYTELIIFIDLWYPTQLPEKLSFTFPAWDDAKAWVEESSKPQM